jgi:hypothetical protein
MMLISSLMPFRGGEQIASLVLDSDKPSASHRKLVYRSLDARIDLFGS